MSHEKHQNKTHKKEGIISISSKKFGYVSIPNQKNDIEIEPNDLGTALHGDTVEISVYPIGKTYGVKKIGKVEKIISRAKKNFTGILLQKNGVYFLKADDPKMYAEISIPEKFLAGAKVGEKIFVELVSWKNVEKPPEGKVLKVLGCPGENDVEMRSIAIEKGFDAEFSKEVEVEAKKTKNRGLLKEDCAGRKDFRKILTFTIDPSDAKDFDDAVSFREIKQREYEVGIHIADVSHYVKKGSALDIEAKNRGTSVYLVDRTIPMLPEELSNDLCSLVPHKDRLTLSAVFTIDKNAKILSEWYGRTIIHSKKRFTYEEAENSIKNVHAPLHKELSILNHLAKKMTHERMQNGAISLEQEEVKFMLDKKGVPIKVIKKIRGDSNKMIEEFMLLANKKVASLLGAKHKKHGSVSIYRVHDLPNREKMLELSNFLRSLGYKMPMQDGIIPSKELNKLMGSLSNEDIMSDTVYRAIVRSMAKAVYSTKNIGHYGLGYSFYTHFTSPIRRYPDIIIHRLLVDELTHKEKEKINLEEKLLEYEKMARVASEQEKRAADAERASVKYKQVEYMSAHLGQIYKGVVSGVAQWGLYVEEIETKCEGLISLRNMNDDFYVFNEKSLELYGQKKKKKYRLGDRVKIKVLQTNLERKTIDYLLV